MSVPAGRELRPHGKQRSTQCWGRLPRRTERSARRQSFGKKAVTEEQNSGKYASRTYSLEDLSDAYSAVLEIYDAFLRYIANDTAEPNPAA